MKTRALPAWFGVGFLLAAAGCSDQGSDPVAPGNGSEPVSLAQQIQPLFTFQCVGCHGEAGNAGLDLRQGASFANLVGVAAQASAGQRVVPGNAADSILYRRLTGDGLGLMPPGGALGAEAVELVQRWIDEGAADN